MVEQLLCGVGQPWHDGGMTRWNRAVATGASQTPVDVAAAGLRGVDWNRALVVPGPMSKMGTGVLNAIPAALRRVIVPRFAQ